MVGTLGRPLQNYPVAVAMGAVRNTNNNPYGATCKFGRSGTVATTVTNLSNLGTYWFPVLPQQVRIKAGGSADDDVGGSGMLNIEIHGIDSNLEEKRLLIDTSGASASSFTDTFWWRIFRVVGKGVGTYGGGAAANITLESDSSEDVIQFKPAENQTEYGHFAIPRLHTALVHTITLTVEAAKTVTFRLMHRDRIDVVSAGGPVDMQATHIMRNWFNVPQGVWPLDLSRSPLKIAALSDVFMTAQALSSVSAAGVEMSYDLIPNS